MFLDSLVGDAAWKAKYALDLEGNPIPFEIIEEEIRATHAFAVFQLRAMLAVSYFEKALYELPEEQVNAEMIQALADNIELKIQGGFSPRPNPECPAHCERRSELLLSRIHGTFLCESVIPCLCNSVSTILLFLYTSLPK